MYRHPHAHAESFEYIANALQKSSLYKKGIFLLGDLNNDYLQPQAKLRKIVHEAKFTQLIEKPTRITSTSKTLLDVIITNRKDLVLSSDITTCNYSDHDIISTVVDIDKPPKLRETKTFRTLKDYNKEIFCNRLLANVPSFNSILGTDNVNDQVDIFTLNFKKSLDSCAPIITKTIHRPPAPWMNDEIRKEMQNRNRLRQRRDLEHDDIVNELYRASKKRVKYLIEKAKQIYYNRKFLECKTRHRNMWDVIKKIIPNKKQNQNVMYTENSDETAEHFNDFFANVGKSVYEETRNNLGESNNPTNNPSASRNNRERNLFRPQPVSIDKVISTVKSLSNNSSYGDDGITGRFLKDSLPVTAFYLTIIINTSIVTGIFPEKWKFALVNPLFKKGDPQDPSSFRPISLLSTLSKVIEKIVADQLYDHMMAKDLFSPTQHGFRRHLSTETALLQITEKLYENIDNNEISLLCLCDLSKAFDSVSHSILLDKLNLHHIDSFWFKDYLSNRTQSVKVNKFISSKLNVEYGVPQGSVLGPLLFNIFINDLNTIAGQSLLVQFADDAQFLLSSKMQNIDHLINQAEETIERANRYFSENGLKVNSDKTQFIFIGSRNHIHQLPNNLNIRVGASSIAPSSQVKNLGIIMDNTLDFDMHINYLSNKANGILYFIHRQKALLDSNSRICVIEALVNSLLFYGSIIWSGCTKSLKSKIQKVHNFAAKVADGRGKKFERATPYIRKLGWMKVNEKIQFNILMFIFKLRTGEIPEHVLDMQIVGEQQERSTRQSNDYLIRRTRTKVAENSMKNRGARLWNGLPQVIKDITRPSTFKKEIKNILTADSHE